MAQRGPRHLVPVDVHAGPATISTSCATCATVYEVGNLLRAALRPVAQPRFGAGDVGSLYSPMVYDAAAVALYALRQEIGDAAFRTLLREWPQRNADRAVTTAGLHRARLGDRRPRPQRVPERVALRPRQPPMPGHPTWSVRG